MVVAPWQRIRGMSPPWQAVAVYVIAKLVMTVGVWLALGRPDGFMHSLATAWDGGHFLDRAQEGYRTPDHYAFAPLYPMLGRALGATPEAMLLVGNGAAIGAVWMVTRLYGLRAGIFFACFPTWLVFSTAAYSEGLFVLLAATALWLVRRAASIGDGLLAGFVAVLAIATRYSSAVGFLVLGLVLLGRKKAAGAGFAIMGCAGAAFLMAWFHTSGGGPFAYFEGQERWGASLAWPWEHVRWMLHGWFTNSPAVLLAGDPSLFLWRNLAFWTIPLAGTVWALTTRRWSVVAYCAPLTLLVICTVGIPAFALPRLLLVAFPAVAIVGSQASRMGLMTYACTATLVGAWMLTGHVTGQFVA